METTDINNLDSQNKDYCRRTVRRSRQSSCRSRELCFGSKTCQTCANSGKIAQNMNERQKQHLRDFCYYDRQRQHLLQLTVLQQFQLILMAAGRQKAFVGPEQTEQEHLRIPSMSN